MAKVINTTNGKVSIIVAPGIWVETPSLCFVPQVGDVIREFVPKIIKYIKDNKIKCDCKIAFNEIEISISAESKAEDVINEYLDLRKLSC